MPTTTTSGCVCWAGVLWIQSDPKVRGSKGFTGANGRYRSLLRRLEEAVPLGVPAGLPSALLGRRPDVLSAEQRLRAAKAEIGVAKAAYFPQIALTTFVGKLSTNSARGAHSLAQLLFWIPVQEKGDAQLNARCDPNEIVLSSKRGISVLSAKQIKRRRLINQISVRVIAEVVSRARI